MTLGRHTETTIGYPLDRLSRENQGPLDYATFRLSPVVGIEPITAKRFTDIPPLHSWCLIDQALPVAGTRRHGYEDFANFLNCKAGIAC